MTVELSAAAAANVPFITADQYQCGLSHLNAQYLNLRTLYARSLSLYGVRAAAAAPCPEMPPVLPPVGSVQFGFSLCQSSVSSYQYLTGTPSGDAGSPLVSPSVSPVSWEGELGRQRVASVSPTSAASSPVSDSGCDQPLDLCLRDGGPPTPLPSGGGADGGQRHRSEEGKVGGNSSSSHTLLVQCSERYRCDQCGKMYSRLANLKIHARTHRATHCFQCEVCGRRLISQWHLAKHRAVHSQGTPSA